MRPTPVRHVIAKVAVYRLTSANMARCEERPSRLATMNPNRPHKKPAARKIKAPIGPPRVPAVNPTSEVPDTAAIADIRNQSVGGGAATQFLEMLFGWSSGGCHGFISQAISRPAMQTSQKRPKPAVCSRFRGGEA